MLNWLMSVSCALEPTRRESSLNLCSPELVALSSSTRSAQQPPPTHGVPQAGRGCSAAPPRAAARRPRSTSGSISVIEVRWRGLRAEDERRRGARVARLLDLGLEELAGEQDVVELLPAVRAARELRVRQQRLLELVGDAALVELHADEDGLAAAVAERLGAPRAVGDQPLVLLAVVDRLGRASAFAERAEAFAEATRARGDDYFGEAADNLTGVLVDLAPLVPP